MLVALVEAGAAKALLNRVLQAAVAVAPVVGRQQPQAEPELLARATTVAAVLVPPATTLAAAVAAVRERLDHKDRLRLAETAAMESSGPLAAAPITAVAVEAE
jgi:hypothetical protein